MSFVINIWKQPDDLAVPTTVIEANRVVDALFQRGGPVPPDFADLSQRLIQRYPWMNEEDQEARAPDRYRNVFIDGWEGESADMVWNLGIYGDDPQFTAIYHAIVYEAVNAGLNVLDGQNGFAFLAGFQVLSTGPADTIACLFADEARTRGEWNESFQRFGALAAGGNSLAADTFADMVISGAGDKRESRATGLAILWHVGRKSKVERLIGLLPERLQSMTVDAARQQVKRIKSDGLQAVIDALPAKKPAPGAPQRSYAWVRQRMERYPYHPEDLLAAARAGDARASNALALREADGFFGRPKNAAQAVYWWMRASEGGLAAADAQLGAAFLDGTGVPRDRVEARLRLVSAARRGSGLAFYHLSRLVELDEGHPGRSDLAQALLIRARELGTDRAKPVLAAPVRPELDLWLKRIRLEADLGAIIDASAPPTTRPVSSVAATPAPGAVTESAGEAQSVRPTGIGAMLACAALAGGILVLSLVIGLSLGALTLPLWGLAAVLGAVGCYRAGAWLGDSAGRRVAFALAALLPMLGFAAVCWVGVRFLSDATGRAPSNGH